MREMDIKLLSTMWNLLEIAFVQKKKRVKKKRVVNEGFCSVREVKFMLSNLSSFAPWISKYIHRETMTRVEWCECSLNRVRKMRFCSFPSQFSNLRRMWIAMEIAPVIRTTSSAIETLREEKIRFSDFVSTIRLELSLIEQQGKTRVLNFELP